MSASPTCNEARSRSPSLEYAPRLPSPDAPSFPVQITTETGDVTGTWEPLGNSGWTGVSSGNRPDRVCATHSDSLLSSIYTRVRSSQGGLMHVSCLLHILQDLYYKEISADYCALMGPLYGLLLYYKYFDLGSLYP